VNHEQIAVIGGGPAGLAAALAASEAGADEIVLIERDRELGGILNQCVHDGFGNLIFGCSLTGPEYAHRFVDQLPQHPPIKVLTDTMVLQLKQDRRLKAVNREGAFEMKPGSRNPGDGLPGAQPFPGDDPRLPSGRGLYRRGGAAA